MAVDKPVIAYLTPMEFTEKIRSLGLNDLARLRTYARKLARFSRIDPDDLAQEAIFRTMVGDRNCPCGFGILPFLYSVMRSIVSDAAKSWKRHPEVELEPLTGGGKDWASDCLTPQQEIVAREDDHALSLRLSQARQAVLGLFHDDLVAQTIAEGILEGLGGEDLRNLTELDKTEFASKRRLIRRRIDKAFPESALS